MEIQFSKSAQAALYKMIHQTAGIDPKQIAEIIGDSHKTVLNYANPNMDYLPSLKKFEGMLLFTQNPVVLQSWAHRLGYALIPTGCDGDKHHELSVIEAMMQHNICNGQANQKVYEAYEDGVITPAEYEEIHSIFLRIIEFATAADQAAYKQMQKYTATTQTVKNEKA
ncbi:phage regulatory CII family protein [Acinetobacter radioresistens]|uniref:phage regulatory CII family protein n=1 Tax=Acinetobacter radioresistens TaxID=40216 RepID=UPI00124FCED7|nr:phage regulatory CII family protein [Acinetobacter radioresistens]